MADNLNLIKISGLQPTTVLNPADIIPISQDGQTRSIKGAVLEQNLLNKTDARYIENSKKGVPNGVATLDANGNVEQIGDLSDLYLGKTATAESAKGSGGVEQGNELAVSGGEVYDYTVGIIGGGVIPINLQTEKPTKDGVFLPTEAGVYLNFGGLELTQEEVNNQDDVKFIYIGGRFEKQVKSFQVNGVIEPNNTEAVAGGDIYKYGIRDVGTIEELRNIEGKEGQTIRLLGYYDAGDKPELLYKWVSGVGEDDGGSVIVVGGGYWEALFGDVVDVRDYGAKGDGVSDDTVFLEKAFNSKKIVTGGCNEYRTTKNISISDIDISIDDIKIYKDFTGSSFLSIFSTEKKQGKVNNTIDIKEGDNYIKIDDTSGISAGDLLYIKCVPQNSGNIVIGRQYVITKSGGDFFSVGAENNNVGTSFLATNNTPNYQQGELLPLWEYDPRPGITNATMGEALMVEGVDTIEGLVYFSDNILDTYSNTYNIEYKVYSCYKTHVNKVSLRGNKGEDSSGITFRSRVNVSVSKCELNYVSERVGISFNGCYRCNVSETKISHGYKVGGNTGYGIQDNGSKYIIISNKCILYKNRRGVDFSGVTPSRMSGVYDCIIESDRNTSVSGLGSHGASDLITFEGNTIIGGVAGVIHRGKRVNINNNIFINSMYYNIVLEYGENCIIDKNISWTFDIYSVIAFLQLRKNVTSSKDKPIIVSNNDSKNIRNSFVRIGEESENTDIKGLIVLNNTITFKPTSTSGVVSIFSNQDENSTTTVYDAIIDNNIYSILRGVYTNYNKGVVFQNYAYKMQGNQLFNANNNIISKWKGGGDITVIHNRVVLINSIEKLTTIKGVIRIEVKNNTAGIKYSGFTRPNREIFTKTKEGYNIWITSAGDIYIGSKEGESYNIDLPVGEHVITLDLLYLSDNSA